MCNHDIVQIHSRHGFLSVTYSDFNIQIQLRYALDTDAILILIQISSSDTLQTRKPFCHLFSSLIQIPVQIRSRHGFHSVTYSDFPQLRYAPDTVVILSLIQIQSSDTTQIRSRYGYHSDAHSFAIQQTFLDGIYKPISNKILSPL